MMTLRCTRKLMSHFDEEPAPAEAIAGPRPMLGDWYANLVLYGSTPMALCVNEKTRYAIVVPLDECSSLFILYIRLAQRIYHAMRRLGVPDDLTRRVLDEHRGGVHVAPTKDRSVVGTMNDLAKHLQWHLEERLRRGPIRHPADLEEDLNSIPHNPLGWANATERLLELCSGG